MARRVTGPDGVRWRVGRQWVQPGRGTRRDRWSNRDDTGGRLMSDSEMALLSGSSEQPASTAAAFLHLVPLAPAVALVVAVPFLIVYFAAGPLALAGVVALLVAATVLVLRRRTWTVRATARGEDRGYVWRVRGWRASGELVDSVAEALRDR